MLCKQRRTNLHTPWFNMLRDMQQGSDSHSRRRWWACSACGGRPAHRSAACHHPVSRWRSAWRPLEAPAFTYPATRLRRVIELPHMVSDSLAVPYPVHWSGPRGGGSSLTVRSQLMHHPPTCVLPGVGGKLQSHHAQPRIPAWTLLAHDARTTHQCHDPAWWT